LVLTPVALVVVAAAAATMLPDLAYTLGRDPVTASATAGARDPAQQQWS
jgi:hypothetical protein